MGKPKVRPPSRVDFLSFPVFGLTWYGSPSSQKCDGCSVIAYCGGGGSSKTGVLNKIVVLITADDPPTDDGSGGGAGVGGGGIGGPISCTSREIEISTGEALCFGVHAFRPYDDSLNMVRILACVGDEVFMYGVPLVARANIDNAPDEDDDDDAKEEAILLGKTSVPKGYGANVATYSALHQNGKMIHCMAVGCENGNVIIFHLAQTGPQSFEFAQASECVGHTKAVCAVALHPRGHQLLSSAKDGTARIFCALSGQDLGVMKCEVHDPKGPAPVQPKATSASKDPRFMKRPPQILVRGCAYGDLEGKVIYTVASGKRGPAYLSKWRTATSSSSSMGPQNPGGPAGAGAPPTQQQQSQAVSIKQEYRIQCSPVPISATSLSSDGTIFALGSVEGSILLYNLESSKIVKEFKEMHDLPVTCIASRPVSNVLPLPGEFEGGVTFDAVSASADNRLGMWTLQKKSRITKQKQPRSSRKKSALESYLWELLRIPLLLVIMLLIVAVRDTMDICSEEFALGALVMDSGLGAARHCLYREVLWAEDGRVSFVPE